METSWLGSWCVQGGYMKRILLVLFALMLGLAVGSVSKCGTAHAQNPSRFAIAEFSQMGQDYPVRSAYILHDNKSREVCFLVMEVRTFHGVGIAMTPRGC